MRLFEDVQKLGPGLYHLKIEDVVIEEYDSFFDAHIMCQFLDGPLKGENFSFLLSGEKDDD